MLELLINDVSVEEEFDILWAGHPPRDGSKGSRRISFKKYEKARREGATFEDFKRAQEAYRALCERQGTIGTAYVLMAQTWFTSRWDDEIELPNDDLSDAMDRLRWA